MNENAKKWVAELRSGNYKQATGGLRKGDCFCCLGVACDLYAKEFSESWISGGTYQEFKGMEGILPEEVSAWLGLGNREGDFYDGEGSHESLADLNDSGCTFSQIADIIESEPGDLFRKES